MALTMMLKERKPSYTSMGEKYDEIIPITLLVSMKKCWSFRGMVDFLAEFLNDLKIYLLSKDKTQENKNNFKWTEKCQKDFDHIKEIVATLPFLHMPTTIYKF